MLIDNGALPDLCNLGVQQEVHALCLTVFLKNFHHVTVTGAADMILHFYDCRVYICHGVISCHFQTDDTAAKHHQMLRKLPQCQHFPVSQHEAGGKSFLQAGNGRNGAGRPSGNNEILSCIGLTAGFNSTAIGGAAGDDAFCVHNIHMTGFQCSAHTAHQRADHLLFSVNNGAVIQRNIFGMDTVGLTVLGMGIQFSAVQQGFGRDAALIETGAAQMGLFDAQNLFLSLSRPLSGQISAGAAA